MQGDGRGHPADREQKGLPANGLDVFATNLLRVKILQEPVVVRHETIELGVPLLRQTLVELFDERQERSFGRKSLLVSVNRDVLMPSKSLAIWAEPEAIEEVFTSHERNVPEMRN